MTNSTSRPMIYFSSLELENVRCFGERQVLELTVDQGRPVQWTLLLGDNGVGKTTLLQCLAWMRPVPFGEAKKKGDPDIQPALTNEENEVFNSLCNYSPPRSSFLHFSSLVIPAKAGIQ